jgi:glyoxylase-like metal-dependent hydrolase (beta-lactamase superfamily II)
MIFRQLFEPESSTYTYLLACPDTRRAVLVDPVLDSVDRDLATVQELGLTLACTLETHVHADHVTSAARLRSLAGSKIACPEMDDIPAADIGVSEIKPLTVGTITLKPLFTPGHTDAHHAYLVDTPDAVRVMTGDALLIDGCGRTDFQGGCAETLYHSIHDKIFTLPDDVLVYPGHDYHHCHVSTVGQERERNSRLGGGKSVEEFVAIMAALKLPYPKKMDVAVPANLRCGEIE